MRRLNILISLLLVVVGLQAQARYIFYFIGDGMGANQVLATEMYLSELNGKIGRQQLRMTQFPFSGQLSTYSESNSITDSSAAGTCLASGKKTTNGHLGVTTNNEPVNSVATELKERGYGVGIMTSVSIDHATPGAFYAHVPERDSYYTIGTQLAASHFDFFGGGTFYQPNDPKDKSATNLYELCKQNGYDFAHGYQEAKEKMGVERMILIQRHEGIDINEAGKGMIPYAIDKTEEDLTLPQITETAIHFLESRYDHFFMMVEGGAIDWACHGNDAATALRDVMEFDQSIDLAYQFYLRHPDETLIVVTADHETGGMALGNHKYTLNLQALQYQTMSAGKISDEVVALHKQLGKKLKWDDVKSIFRKHLGLYDHVDVSVEEDLALRIQFLQMMKNKQHDVKTLYQDFNGLSNAAMELLNKKSHIGWTTHSHSASAVPVFAIGVGAEQFTGWHDNSEVAPMIMKAAQ